MAIGALAGLLDDKLIKIISLFVKYPEKKFYLTEVSKLSGVNNTSTFRIVNRLVTQEIVKSTVIGRVRVYQLAKTERAASLAKMIKSEDKGDGLEKFISRIRALPRVKMVLLDSRTEHSAKIIVISEFSLKDRISKITKEILDSYNFRIDFVELNPGQFEGLRKLNSFGQGKKILFKREA